MSEAGSIADAARGLLATDYQGDGSSVIDLDGDNGFSERRDAMLANLESPTQADALAAALIASAQGGDTRAAREVIALLDGA